MKSNQHERLGERVRRLRIEKGMNQGDLATAAKLKQATISRVESGEIEEPRLGVLRSLASELGITVDYLVGKTDELTASDMLEADPEVEHLFRGYEKLTREGKERLKGFLGYLEQEEKKSKKGKS